MDAKHCEIVEAGSESWRTRSIINNEKTGDRGRSESTSVVGENHHRLAPWYEWGLGRCCCDSIFGVLGVSRVHIRIFM